MNQKLGSLQLYRRHLYDQFCDRTVIWKLQQESADPHTDFLIISTDGLDQSKFALPRDAQLRCSTALTFGFKGTLAFVSCPSNAVCSTLLSKQIFPYQTRRVRLRSKHQRPRIKVHGAWAFGFCLNVYILDENAAHDSSAIIEMLSATLEDVTCYDENMCFGWSWVVFKGPKTGPILSASSLLSSLCLMICPITLSL